MTRQRRYAHDGAERKRRPSPRGYPEASTGHRHNAAYSCRIWYIGRSESHPLHEGSQMKKRRTVVPPSLTKYQSKPMPHWYVCSVCLIRSNKGRRRLTKNGIAFICHLCLSKALYEARERSERLRTLRDAEDTIRKRKIEGE